MQRIKLLVVIALICAGCTPVSAAPASLQAQDPRLVGKWIDMSLAPQLIEWYNGVATPQDIARVDHVSMVDLLDDVTVGRRLVIFKNAADIEELVPRLADKIDIIGYNLERGPANRPDEQSDPVGSVRRVRALADQYGMQLAFGPDRAFALSDGVAIAPYVDLFVLQVQRVQTEPEVVREFVIPMVEGIRAANPAVQVSLQVRTEGDVAQIVELLGGLAESIDGISILTSQETLPIAEELWSAIRPQVAQPLPTGDPAAPPELPPIPTPTELQGGVLLSPTPTVERRNAGTAPIQTAPVELIAPRLRWWLVVGGAFLGGVLLSALAATLIIFYLRGEWRW
jgi:hypothetical protein